MLSDEKKRRIYDRYGKEGLTNGAGSSRANGYHHAGAHHGTGRHHPYHTAAGHNLFDDFFASFVFRDPEEVFREFFRNDPFSPDPFGLFGEPLLFAGGAQPNGGAPRRHAGARQPAGQGVQGVDDIFNMNPFMMNPFGGLGAMGMLPMGMGMPLMGGFGNLFGQLAAAPMDPMGAMTNGGVTTFTSSSVSYGGGPNMRQTSSSTRFVNGKKIETRKVVENGVETVTVVEDGVVKKRTVNGQPQALQAAAATATATGPPAPTSHARYVLHK